MSPLFFAFCYYFLVVFLQSCEIRKTKLYYTYDGDSDSLTGHYQRSTYDSDSGNVTIQTWNTTIEGPLLKPPTTTTTTTTVKPTTKVDWTKFNCPNNKWTQFSRTTYNYCFQAVYSKDISQSNAETDCQRLGGNLAGFQNSNERQSVQQNFYIEHSPFVTVSNYLWIGLKTSSCINVNDPSSYTWMDSLTKGTDGMNWPESQPDCSGSCVVLNGGQYWGLLYASTCGADAHPIIGYICGRRAGP
ncbi:unnamed protein product [Caenorhabditis angaria]|uniref:C-type lectin domain-containing protein n=1 Tax=Caenorhabditis angaria TaxID=860376 RepID=A0A9P1IF60_9PELO|nr:unnamed protein product [Caenorhabditis angaria]